MFLWVFVSIVWEEEAPALLSEELEDEIIGLAYATMMETIERLDKKLMSAGSCAEKIFFLLHYFSHYL